MTASRRRKRPFQTRSFGELSLGAKTPSKLFGHTVWPVDLSYLEIFYSLALREQAW
jgi:hypothetical protein